MGPFESYVKPMLGQGPRWTKLGYVGHVWVPKGTYVGLCWGHLRLCWANDGPMMGHLGMLGAKSGSLLGDLEGSNTGPQKI